MGKPQTRKAISAAIEREDEADNHIVLPASTAATLDEDTVVLFELDGKKYHIPARPRAVVALRYLRAVRQGGTEAAAAQLLTDLVGADGFNALCEYEDLKPEQLRSIMSAAQRMTVGAFEEAFSGNSNGSAR